MDDKLKELLARTNLDELVRREPPALDLNQPVASAPEPEPRVLRSTADPLQIHFASADMLGQLTKPSTPTRLRVIGMVLITLPLALIGLAAVLHAWTDPLDGGWLHPHDGRDVLRVVLGTGIFVLLTVAAPWAVHRASRR